MPSPMPPPPTKSVFVTGANGYIGFAVCRAFVRAGWKTYGLVRRAESAHDLAAKEIIPIVGSVSPDTTFLKDLYQYTKTVDVVVSCTEQLPFGAHFEALVAIFRELAETSNRNGVGPLVLFSSGCKDYGTTGVHGSPGLAPHTEESPLRPAAFVQERTYSSLKIFEHADLFDAALIRPTPLFGYDGSYTGFAFELGAAATKAEDGTLRIPHDFNTIIHSCHVDDCAEAYLALAEYPDRKAVAGQCFNISGHSYDTLGSIAQALSTEYNLHGGVVPGPSSEETASFVDLLFGYSQWVDSTKIRQLTGWTDKRLGFAENLHVYRMAYEAAAKQGHDGVLRIKERIENILTPTGK
ncbi:NAD(P)-binding protein [Hypoxylon fragiforme]|uniref:NAD(P)-binding protein n=1 Tax=Hypoxylon fragiforme TaxID=63214 RepID=UPI0020C6A53C|nr:NAD(P)-binding protein [Hypoxylon fragiforme]KAI2604355.1 NAD(P)-binding protein [Hypoxylon fragiforme]